jgi:chromosome segregation ATPase
MKKKPTKASHVCVASGPPVEWTSREVQALFEANANIENLTRLLSDSDRKRHELFEQVTEAKREIEGWRADTTQARTAAKQALAEIARLSADNRMLFSLLVSERGHNDRKRSMEAPNEVIGAVAAAMDSMARNGR